MRESEVWWWANPKDNSTSHVRSRFDPMAALPRNAREPASSISPAVRSFPGPVTASSYSSSASTSGQASSQAQAAGAPSENFYYSLSPWQKKRRRRWLEAGGQEPMPSYVTDDRWLYQTNTGATTSTSCPHQPNPFSLLNQPKLVQDFKDYGSRFADYLPKLVDNGHNPWRETAPRARKVWTEVGARGGGEGDRDPSAGRRTRLRPPGEPKDPADAVDGMGEVVDPQTSATPTTLTQQLGEQPPLPGPLFYGGTYATTTDYLQDGGWGARVNGTEGRWHSYMGGMLEVMSAGLARAITEMGDDRSKSSLPGDGFHAAVFGMYGDSSEDVNVGKWVAHAAERRRVLIDYGTGRSRLIDKVEVRERERERGR